MNQSAEKHLAKAEGYLAKGENYYRKAAEEVIAAKAADFSLSNREIAERFGRGEKWVRDLVRWITTSSEPTKALYATDTPRRQTDQAKQVLREAPLEQVEQMIAELPPERQQQVAAAAGHAYHKARVDFDEKERNLTPAQRKERQAAGEAMTRPVVSVTASFEIVSKLEVVLELLRDLNSGGTIPEGMIEPTGQLLEAIQQEYRVLRAMAGLSIDLDEVEA